MIICFGGTPIICEVEWGCVGVTPSANRNSYRVGISFYIIVPRVEVLRPSTLGWEIATPTELLLLTGLHLL